MKDKTAIITGRSRGLGRNTAVNFARRGVDVIFTYHSNQTEAENLISEIATKERRAAGFRLDTGDIHLFDGFVAEVRKTLQGWGRERFDYLVNNVGNSLHKQSEETTEAEFDGIVNVHFKGVYFLTQKLLPADKRRRSDHQYFARLGAFLHAGHFSLWSSKGSSRSVDALPGERTWTAGHNSQCGCPGRRSDRLQRWDSA